MVDKIFYLIGVMAWLWVSLILFIGTFTLYIAIMKMREVKERLWRGYWLIPFYEQHYWRSK